MDFPKRGRNRRERSLAILNAAFSSAPVEAMRYLLEL